MIELPELPELAILLILEHLSYEDLQSLRVTCKKLKETIDRRTARSLHLFVKDYPRERELIYTDESISYANTFQASELTILRSTKFKSLFTGLRKLTIYTYLSRSDNPKPVDLDDLNCFHNLVHLQLERVSIKNGKLDLRNLKIALLENESHETTNFELDCPQLQVLGLGYQTRPRLNQETASSVRYLYLQSRAYGETSLFLLFAKLKCLSICFISSKLLNTFVVALMERRVNLPSLKQIQLKGEWYFPERGVVLRNLIELKRRNETKHIEVLINGKVMDRNELTELLDLLCKILPETPEDPEDPEDPENPDRELCIGDLEEDLLRHFSENPILRCLLPSAYSFTLRSDEDVTISKQLIARLRNITTLAIEIALDSEYFECILKTVRRISYLKLFSCAHLKQQQLDRMPDYLANLSFLSLGSDFLLGNFNLNFVSKFKHLFLVVFDFNIPKETMSFLFKNCKDPRFHLKLNGKQLIWIGALPNERGFFEITCRKLNETGASYKSPKNIEFRCLEEAIDYYYRNDLFNTPFDWRAAFGFPCTLI